MRYFYSLLALMALSASASAQPPVPGRGYILPAPEVKAALHADAFKRHGLRMQNHVQAMTAPAQFDSTTMGWIPPIRDQGSCGDCFGVSASDALVVAYCKTGQQKADGSYVISEQYGLDCGTYPGGCNGGDGPQVYAIMKSKGFPAEKYVDSTGKSVSDYPGYTANPSSCRLKSGAKMWKCADWGYVTSDQSDRAPTVDEVKAGVMNYGCVTFAFDAGALNGYTSGVIKRLGNNIDHEITGFIGWDDSKRALKCRNQWGKSFGEAGYFWLSYDALPAVVEACFLTAVSLPPPPPPVLTVTLTNGTAQVGVPYTFAPVVTGAVGQYTTSFDFGDGSKAVAITHTYTTAGTFKAVASVIDSQGSLGVGSATVTVGTGPPPPPPPITVTLPDVTTQVNVPAVFTLGVSGGTEPYASVFAYGDGAVGSATMHTYTAAGTYKVVVSIIDAKKVTGAGACTVTVSSGPTPPPPGSITISGTGTVADGTYTRTDGAGTVIIIGGVRYAPVGPAAPPPKEKPDKPGAELEQLKSEVRELRAKLDAMPPAQRVTVSPGAQVYIGAGYPNNWAPLEQFLTIK